MSDPTGVQSVVRTFNLLEILCNNGNTGITKLSKLSGLSKATVYRLVNTLVALGYVKKDEQTENYCITVKFLNISAKQLSDYDIRKEMHPVLEKISKECGETVHLIERVGNEIIYIDKIENSGTSFRMASYVGLSLPLIYTASGKAILSHLSDKEIVDIWNSSSITKLTAKTITDLEKFVEEINKIRQNGYAVDNEENEIGVCCVSKAVSDFSGKYKYAISVSAPKIRMTQKKIAEIQQLFSLI